MHMLVYSRPPPQTLKQLLDAVTERLTNAVNTTLYTILPGVNMVCSKLSRWWRLRLVGWWPTGRIFQSYSTEDVWWHVELYPCWFGYRIGIHELFAPAGLRISNEPANSPLLNWHMNNRRSGWLIVCQSFINLNARDTARAETWRSAALPLSWRCIHKL